MSGFYKNVKKTIYPSTPTLDKLNQCDCIKYPHCGAQLCPLDKSWKSSQNFKSKELCFLISEAQNPEPDSWVLLFYPKEFIGDICKLLPTMKQQHPFVFETQEKTEDIPVQSAVKQSQSSCDRYEGCSAQICPLDPEWRKRKHIKGERVCNYLTDAVKGGAETLFRGTGRGWLYEAAQRHLPDIIAAHVPIKFAVERAKKKGFRLEYKQEVSA